jgi:cobalt-zinc-cadmium efflux system outer membrane protein
MFKLSSRVLLILMFALMADACARYQYEPEPVETLHSIEAYHKRSLDSPALGEFIGQYDTGSTLWPISRWDLASLTLAAWYFNPQLQIAIAGHQKSIAEQETAGQLINPRLGLPFEYHSDTTGGVSPWLIGLVFDLVLERPAKRQARLDRTRAGVDLAKTNIYSVAWDIYSNLRKHYIALYQAREIRKNLSEQAAITEEMLSLLQKRRQAGQASDFEVAVIRIELQRLKIALSQQQLAEIDSLVHLAGVVGVSSTEI